MNFIVKNFVIVSLLISVTFSSFIDFQQNLEYNLHFTFETIIEANDVKEATSIFDANLQLQKLSKNEFYCAFNNVTHDEDGFEEIHKPFKVTMNGSRVDSVTFSSKWERDEILNMHGMVKALLWDRTDITRFFEAENWSKNDQKVHLPLGVCESDINISLEKTLLSIQAESTKDRCVVTNEEKTILGPHVDTIDSSSHSLVRLSYDKENREPKVLCVKLRLRFPNGEVGKFIDYTGIVTAVLKNTKKIESKIELEGELMTMTKQEMLELNKIFH